MERFCSQSEVLFEKTAFSKGLDVLESKYTITKVFSLETKVENLPSVCSLL